MATLWWKWNKRTIIYTSPGQNIGTVMKALLIALVDYQGYMGLRIQNSGDLVGIKNGLTFAVTFLPIGSPYYWQIVACGGGSKGEADIIFKDVQGIVNELVHEV